MISTFMMFSPALLAAAIAVYGVLGQSDISLSQPLQNILANTNSSLYTYPTYLTQGIVPKPIHSHNDYWRTIPFYSALSVGSISVEGDVWLYNDTLHVGHETSALTAERTFDCLYIQPILSVLKAQNPKTSFVSSTTHNGVFDTNSAQTLYLWIDVKTNGSETWPYVVKALEPLRAGGWLTTLNGTEVTTGAVTVIGTGNTPLQEIQGLSNRDYFYDAPLELLGSTASNITSDVSVIASTNFQAQFGSIRNDTFNSTQLALLRSQIQTAHAKNIGVRYWNQPEWPIGTRNAIWTTLWEEGVDLLSVDDLEAAANF